MTTTADDVRRSLARQWPIIAVVALVAAAVTYFGTDARPAPGAATYAATHTLLVTGNAIDGPAGSPDNPDHADAGEGSVGVGGDFGSEWLEGETALARLPILAAHGDVPDRVAAELGTTATPAELTSAIKVEADIAAGTVEFTAEHPDPAQAVALADSFALHTARYVSERQAAALQQRQTEVLADIDRLEQELVEIDELLRSEATGAGVGSEGSSITRARRDAVASEYTAALATQRRLADVRLSRLASLSPAAPVAVEVPSVPALRTRATRVPLAALLGGVVGVGPALLADRVGGRLRDRRRVAEAFGAEVLGEIPALTRGEKASQPLVREGATGWTAEAFRSLSTVVEVLLADGRPISPRLGVVVVTSSGPAEGKTTTTANLAAALAETGRSVLVVNADFRRPAIARLLAPVVVSSLYDKLDSLGDSDPADLVRPTMVSGVKLLDLSPLPQPPGELARATVRLVETLSGEFDVVLVDSPPLVLTAEALEFVPLAALTLLIGRLGVTTAPSARRAGELVHLGGGALVGVVITQAAGPDRAHRRYYTDTPQQIEVRRARQRHPTALRRRREAPPPVPTTHVTIAPITIDPFTPADFDYTPAAPAAPESSDERTGELGELGELGDVGDLDDLWGDDPVVKPDRPSSAD